ncbi:MAG TPA: hypothetical protein H9720_05890 [Candidatus Limosilactobacillus intestinigallinarum]|nr:hypothetical protein [Candidatus Limosilactobacillus intestinigallinarum]
MEKVRKDNVNVANPVPVTAQNIDGSIPVNDLTSKIIYLLGQSERHTEQLSTINNTTHDLKQQLQSLHSEVNDHDQRLNDRIDRVLDKVDTNFKWTVGTLIMPIITMVITIIVNLLLTQK